MKKFIFKNHEEAYNKMFEEDTRRYFILMHCWTENEYSTLLYHDHHQLEAHGDILGIEILRYESNHQLENKFKFNNGEINDILYLKLEEESEEIEIVLEEIENFGLVLFLNNKAIYMIIFENVDPKLFSQLSNYPFLQMISVFENDFLTDLSCFNCLSQLKYLELASIPLIHDFSTLLKNSNLVYLHILDFELKIEQSLGMLTQLNGLKIRGLETEVNLNLEAFRNLEYLSIDSFSTLQSPNIKNLDKLKTLFIANGNLEKIEAKNNVSLTKITIFSYCNIDLHFLRETKNLKSLITWGASNFENLIYVNKLEVLETYLEKNSDSFLGLLTNLKKLKLIHSPNLNFSFFSKLTKLEHLETEVEINKNISPFSNLNNLVSLTIRAKSMVDLKPLEQLNKLKKLSLSITCQKHEQINLNFLFKLKLLDYLHLGLHFNHGQKLPDEHAIYLTIKNLNPTINTLIIKVFNF